MKHSELNDQYWAVISCVCMFVTWGFIAIQAMMPDKVIDKSQQNLTYGKCGEWGESLKEAIIWDKSSITPNQEEGLKQKYKEDGFKECNSEDFQKFKSNLCRYERVCTKPLLCEKKIIYEQNKRPTIIEICEEK